MNRTETDVIERLPAKLAAAPEHLQLEMREYLASATDSNACYMAGYIMAMVRTHDMAGLEGDYWLELVQQVCEEPALAREALVALVAKRRELDAAAAVAGVSAHD
jgi:hypothetical protein